MIAPTLSQVGVETYGGNEYGRHLSTDSVPEGAPFNEPRQSPSGVRPPLLDDTTLFCDGAGI